MLKKIALLSMAIAIVGTFAAAADDKKEPPKPPEKKADAFDKLKLLAGEWVGKGSDGKDTKEAKVTYKVTSGGTAVVETIDPAGPHEMVSVITRDGDSLAFTHYCMLGNQPHFKAENGTGDKVVFKFVNGDNMKSDKDMHMHGVTYTFVDNDTLKAEWTACKDGKDAGNMVFELKRKKGKSEQ